jgi:hypothetical protein
MGKADTGRRSPWLIALPYANARELDLPIFFKGEDLPLADIGVARSEELRTSRPG